MSDHPKTVNTQVFMGVKRQYTSEKVDRLVEKDKKRYVLEGTTMSCHF